jgi:hypothetical protein
VPGAQGLAGAAGGQGLTGPTGTPPTGFDLIPLKQQVATEATNTATARPLSPDVPLASRGVISIYAKCLYGGSSDFTSAEIYARTTQDGATWNSGTTPSALNIGTAEGSRVIDSQTASGTRNIGLAAPPKVIHIIGPDGSIFTASFEFGATTIGGAGLFPSAHSCFFHGYAVG